MKICYVLFAILLLAGCKYDLPLPDAGSVELHSNGSVTKGELSRFQIEALAEWVRAHRTGWKFNVEDRYPELLVSLKRDGAIVAVLNIRAREVAVKNLVRPITAEEHTKLSTILTSFFTNKIENNQALEPTAPAGRGSSRSLNGVADL